MKQTLYILRFVDDGGILFKYDTSTRNPKKAIFNTVKQAELAAIKINESGILVYVDSIS